MDAETPNPNIHWHDAATGETVERPMTDDEYSAFLEEMQQPEEETPEE